MELYTLLILGCVIGMQHAMEADHLAAVAALSKDRNSRRALVLRGGFWGLGHTITLVTICGALLLLGETISARTEAILELAVGAMILYLGLSLLYKVSQRRPHFHIHHHGAEQAHLHVHTHTEDEIPHKQNEHQHSHRNLGLRRAMLVGMMHGVAGSAGLLLLAAAAKSLSEAVAYIVAFGAGSIIGMAALTFVISYPLKWMERGANWLKTATFAGIACAAIFIGANLIGHSWNLI
jgi:ABC-type nickel/cobalt efflux system permease component RcnA